MKFFKKITDWLRSHKLVVSLVVFTLLVGVIYLPPRIQAFIQGPEAIYETTKPQKKDLVQAVDVSGEIRAQDEAVLKFQASGKLAWVGVKKGDRVKKWQAIASLDKAALKKNLEKEMYDYLSERWDFEQAHEDYGTSGLPLEKGLIDDAAKRILEKSQFDLNQTVLDLEIDQLTYNLATIYSPIEGIVTEIDSPVPGVNITPATATFTVANPEVMVFEANVDEADIGKVKIGQKATINLDAYPDEEFEGLISKIDFASVTTRGGGTAFPIEVILPENEDLKFKIGLNGDAEIIIEEKKDALSLPLEAITEKNGEAMVRVIEKKEIKELQVTTGLSTDTRVEIVAGLAGEEKIISGKKKKEK